jgi:peptide/nickel transport system permease protein
MKFKTFWIRFKRNNTAIFGLILILLILAMALFAPIIAPYSPTRIRVGPRLVPPNLKYLLGTDDLGRDILSQIIWSSRISLLVGFVSAAISTLVGIIIGSISGYFGGFIDKILMRFTEVILVIPTFVLTLALVALYGSSYIIVIIVLSFASWPSTARLVRAEYLSQKERQYVEAAKAIGLDDKKIIFNEILPNAMPPIIVNTSIGVARAILLEAGLSFLGAGDPNVVSWGWMLNSGFRFIHTSWWMITFPGFALFLTALSLNLIGDGLNDALNPRLKNV